MSVHSFNGISTNGSYFSHGTVKLINSVTSYSWTINNFCVCRKRTGEVLDSPVISAGADGEHRWRILLYPKGRSDEHREYISIFLFLLSCNESKLEVQAKFSILNEKNEESNERRVEQQLHRGKGLGCSDFIKRAFILDKVNGLLPDGHLTIRIEISTGLGLSINQLANNSVIHEMSPAEQCLSVDLEHLLEDQKYADVILTSHGKSFKVHKNILAARSSVFSKTFEVKNKNTLEMDDVETEVLQEMLRFVYTGKVDNISKFGNSLLVAAENYKLDGLKTMCEDALCKNLTVDNSVDTLILADTNKAERLRTHAISFIIAHAKDVLETPGYKLIAESHQLHLLAEVFRVLALQHH